VADVVFEEVPVMVGVTVDEGVSAPVAVEVGVAVLVSSIDGNAVSDCEVDAVGVGVRVTLKDLVVVGV
jgi:hypothetical protein